MVLEIIFTEGGKLYKRSFKIRGYQKINGFPLRPHLPVPHDNSDCQDVDCKNVYEQDKEQHFSKSGWTHQFEFTDLENVRNYLVYRERARQSSDIKNSKITLYVNGSPCEVDGFPQFATTEPCCYGNNLVAKTLAFARIVNCSDV